MDCDDCRFIFEGGCDNREVRKMLYNGRLMSSGHGFKCMYFKDKNDDKILEYLKTTNEIKESHSVEGDNRDNDYILGYIEIIFPNRFILEELESWWDETKEYEFEDRLDILKGILENNRMFNDKGTLFYTYKDWHILESDGSLIFRMEYVIE